MSAEVRFVKVLVLYKDSDLAVVKSLLNAAQIPYFIENENFSQMHGLAIGMGVRVIADRLNEAQEILKTFL